MTVPVRSEESAAKHWADRTLRGAMTYAEVDLNRTKWLERNGVLHIAFMDGSSLRIRIGNPKSEKAAKEAGQ